METKVMSRIEKAALKRMVKNLAPYQKQIERLDAKIAEIEAKKQPILEQMDRLYEAINYYTGGVPYQKVLNPEEFNPEDVVQEVELVSDNLPDSGMPVFDLPNPDAPILE